jgi:hypothetical protein
MAAAKDRIAETEEREAIIDPSPYLMLPQTFPRSATNLARRTWDGDGNHRAGKSGGRTLR